MKNKDGRAITILIVENENDIRDLLTELLLGSGYRVISTPDGHAVFSILKSQPIDIILTDLLMPDLDGNALAIILKANPTTSHIPIILQTATRESRKWIALDKFSALIYKPYSFEQLECVIDNLWKSDCRISNY